MYQTEERHQEVEVAKAPGKYINKGFECASLFVFVNCIYIVVFYITVRWNVVKVQEEISHRNEVDHETGIGQTE